MISSYRKQQMKIPMTLTQWIHIVSGLLQIAVSVVKRLAVGISGWTGQTRLLSAGDDASLINPEIENVAAQPS